MGGVLSDSDVGDVCLEHFGRRSTSKQQPGVGGNPRHYWDVRDPSTSLLKQLSMMRRFSSSNRCALFSMAARCSVKAIGGSWREHS